MKNLFLTLILGLTISIRGQSFEISEKNAEMFHESHIDNQDIENMDMVHSKGEECHKRQKNPSPPKLPQNFSWKGRYVVPDLGINVPFTWQGKDGDIQMIAGGEKYPIYFTNFIYNNHLYTYTYKWPGL